MALFDEAEAKRIAAAVGAVEAKTSGEIVVATARRCATYGGPRMVFAVVVGLAAALVAHAVAPEASVEAILGVQLAVGAIAWVIAAWPRLLRLLAGEKALDDAVAEAALAEFAEHGVFDTEGRTGVLIFLAELEHRAVILGDKGIHAEVGAEGWARLVKELIASLADHHGVDGVCRVVDEIGAVLAEHLPAGDGNRNELPNLPRQRG